MRADASKLTLVIDQGTHASRACLVDRRGRVVDAVSREVGLTRRGLEVEQDAEEILTSVREALGEVVGGQTKIARAAVATQRSTVVAWDRLTGKALCPALSWQDTRAEDTLARLDVHAEEIRARTGLRLSAHYGAGKLSWLMAHEPAVIDAAARGRLAMGPLAAFLLFHLIEGRPLLVDHANAARTLLWNLQTHDWDDRLLQLFALDRAWLPQCRPNRHDYGRLAGNRLPVGVVHGDQPAALFASGPPDPETVYINIGTGAFAFLPTGKLQVRHPNLNTGMASSGGGALYYLEGAVNGAGAALSWAARHWNIPLREEFLGDWLAQVENPPLFLNGVSGLGSPWWKSRIEPRLVEEPPAPSHEQPALYISAIIESIAFMLMVNLTAICEVGLPVKRLRVSGGLSRLDALCQRLADLSRLPVERLREIEATALGLAWLAGGLSLSDNHEEADRFSPVDNPCLVARFEAFCAAMESYAA